MSDAQNPNEMTTTRVAAIEEFLNTTGAEFRVFEHEPVMSAMSEAHVTSLSPEQVAKTIVLHDGDAYVIAAVPASERLDMQKIRTLLGKSRQLRLASEEEIANEFPTLEVGAIPPFGPMAPSTEVIDRALLDQKRILCPAGDHRHSVLIDPREVIRITAAKTADICEH